jgi:hypothetical protein
MLCKEIIPVYSENHRKFINKNELLIVEVGEMCNYHLAVKD